MVSAYKEGRLVAGAIESLLEVGLDALLVYEGPAGEPLGDDVPDSIIYSREYFAAVEPRTSGMRVDRFIVEHGRWRTDGRKRNAILQRAKTLFPGQPFWCVVVDADEVLVNGRYLRDRLELIEAENEWRGASVADLHNPPVVRLPLHIVEHSGAIAVITARVFRGDLLRSIDISSSVVTNEAGVREGWGNFEARSAVWIENWLGAIDRGKMIAWPPLPCEPHLVHRSNLRHPLRRGVRMSEQETTEFAKAQAAESLGSIDELERQP